MSEALFKLNLTEVHDDMIYTRPKSNRSVIVYLPQECVKYLSAPLQFVDIPGSIQLRAIFISQFKLFPPLTH